MTTLWQDIRYGLRVLVTNPAFTAVVILVLVLDVRAGAGVSAMAPVVSMGSLSVADSSRAHLDRGPASEVGQPAPEDNRPGPMIAWWRLDEADGNVALDSSGHGFAGTLIGNPQWQPTAGKVKGALALAGTGGFVAITKDPAFDLTGAVTVAAWIKVRTFDTRWQTIIAKGDTAWRLQRTAAEDTLAFHCTGLHSLRGQWPHGIEGRKNVNDDKWHHVAGVYDGAVISLYVDGALDHSSRASGTIQTNDCPVSLGANTEAGGRNWNGLIDEVCVFAGALNADGVRALYAGAEPAAMAQQASVFVSAEDVAAELRARQGNDTNALRDGLAMPSERQESPRWPVALTIVAGAVVIVGVYVVRRRRGAF